MSIFQRHLSAALAARSIAPIAAEADPLADVSAPAEGGEGEGEPVVDEVPAEEGDAFAEQRAALNFNNGMIRNRVAQGDEAAEGGEEGGEAGADGEGGGDPENEGAELVVSAEEELDVPGGDNIGDDIVVVDENSLPEVDGEQVTDVTDSGDVEFASEGDEDESDPEVDELVDGAEREDAEIEALGMELDMLDASAVAIESYGMNPTAMAILQTTGLLSGTALESIGLESCNYVDGKHDESQVALEAIGEKIKDTAAKWAGKILGFAQKIGTGVISILSKIWEKVSGAVSVLTSAAWDKAKAGAAIVKAHPYKTILATIATIGAVAGVITLFGGMPAVTAGAAAVRTWMGTIVTRINGAVSKFPFAKITASLNRTGKKIVIKTIRAKRAVVAGAANAAGAVKGASVTALGWSQTAARSAGGQLKTAYNASIAGAKALGTRVTKLGTAAGSSIKAGAGAAKVGLAAAWGYVSNLAVVALQLFKNAIIAGLTAIKSTFAALVGFVKGGNGAAEVAAAAA